ncbi:DUF6138 family protein [Pectobacterium quasiaquaticum]|uniref:DUF6138 family protein n=1 Tax=Pectobacterium quasiaquaticum TaxID=2774015 RepID=UPI0020216DD8|nr:DUF6138 family protein [Pectobacterium quasiaquaticum]
MTDKHSNETGVSPQHDFPMRDESLTAINKWFDTQEQRGGLDEIISRTTLQAGIHDDVILDYALGRTSIAPESKSDADGLSPGSRKGALSVTQIQESIVPVLTQAIAQRVEKLADTALIDYRFCFRAIFPAMEGRLPIVFLLTRCSMHRTIRFLRIMRVLRLKNLNGTPIRKAKSAVCREAMRYSGWA